MQSSLLEKAISAAGLAVLVLDDDNRVVDITAGAARLLGADPPSLIGAPVGAFIPVERIRSLAEDARTAPPVVEVTLGGLGGTAQPVAVSAARWTDSDGRTLTSVVLRDGAAERAVARQTQSRLVHSDTAIRGAGIGVFEYRPVTDSVQVSDLWRAMMDLSPDDRVDVQAEWRDRVHPDDLARALEPVELCVSGRETRASCEYRLLSRDRTAVRWIRTDIAVAERDATGRPSLLVGAQTDITERRATEEALRVSLAQFRSAFDTAPIGMALAKLDGTLTLVNAALCDLLGYRAEDLARRSLQDLTHAEDRDGAVQHLQALIDGQSASCSFDTRVTCATGAIIWARVRVGLAHDAQGRPDHLVAQLVDITEQRRMDQLRNDFVSVVSHELRTPLTSVLGALTLLELDEAQFSDEVQRLLFIAKANGDRLHNLINDILDFQKFTAREMRFALGSHAVAQLVDESILTNLALSDRHGIRFVPPRRNRTLRGVADRRRFLQIMTNLLSNAAKFADPGTAVIIDIGPDLSVGLGSNSGPDPAMIRISVSNQGRGIPEAFRDRVFMPFSQANTLSDRESGGTGLGLSITRQIVEQMGGQIGYDSTPGGTTTFWFTLRLAAEAQVAVLQGVT